MSFFKKLFFWVKSYQIRESDIKCPITPSLEIPYNFPKRDHYISNKSQPKNYHNQSSSTNDLSTDSSVQCEIRNPLIWHKKTQNKNYESHTKIKTKQNIDKCSNTHESNAPLIEIEIFPEKPKELRKNNEIDLTGIEEFVKNSKPKKSSFGFVFDDRMNELSDNEQEKNENSKHKPIQETNNQLIPIQHESSNKLLKKEEQNDSSILNIKNQEKTENSNFLSELSLPKPKGYFVFEDDDD